MTRTLALCTILLLAACAPMEPMTAEQRQRWLMLWADEPSPRVYVPPYQPVLSQPVSAPPAGPSYMPVQQSTIINPPPAPVQTWGQTPYAPAIPPAMWDAPTTKMNPLIPPVAR